MWSDQCVLKDVEFYEVRHDQLVIGVLKQLWSDQCVVRGVWLRRGVL